MAIFLAQNRIPKGYRPRLSGAVIKSVKTNLECDVCGKLVSLIIGYERQYPIDPDLWICLDCEIVDRQEKNG